MKLRPIALSFALLALVAASACKDKDAKMTADGGSAAGSATAQASAAPPEPKAAAKEVPVDQFLTKVGPAACKTITQCKNDKLKVVATMPIMLIAGFGTLDKPELAKEMKTVDTSMKADKRWTPNESECTTVGGVAMKVLGLQADAMPGKVGKTISYDPKKGAACLEALAKAPDVCAQEVKLATEPKMKDIDGFDKELKPTMDAYAKPCEDVITGLVEVGGACESDVECKGKGTKCKAAKGGAKPKDPKDAKAKTCTAGKP